MAKAASTKKPATKTVTKPAAKAPAKASAKTPAKAPAANATAKPASSAAKVAEKAVSKAKTSKASQEEEDIKPVPARSKQAASPVAAKPGSKPAQPDTDDDVDTNEFNTTSDETAKPRLQRPSVRYSDADLEMFRKHILSERQKAVEEFQILKENLEEITSSEMADENASYSMHMAEQGTNAQEKEKLYAHVQRISDYIKKLDEALQRIDDKIYGICRMCAILIAKERLLAVPITTQSASYKIFKKCPEDGIDRIVRR